MSFKVPPHFSLITDTKELSPEGCLQGLDMTRPNIEYALVKMPAVISSSALPTCLSFFSNGLLSENYFDTRNTNASLMAPFTSYKITESLDHVEDTAARLLLSNASSSRLTLGTPFRRTWNVTLDMSVPPLNIQKMKDDSASASQDVIQPTALKMRFFPSGYYTLPFHQKSSPEMPVTATPAQAKRKLTKDDHKSETTGDDDVAASLLSPKKSKTEKSIRKTTKKTKAEEGTSSSKQAKSPTGSNQTK